MSGVCLTHEQYVGISRQILNMFKKLFRPQRTSAYNNVCKLMTAYTSVLLTYTTYTKLIPNLCQTYFGVLMKILISRRKLLLYVVV